MRKVTSMLFAFVLLLSAICPVFAHEPNQPAPCFTHIASISYGISIDQSTKVATCQGSVTAWAYLPAKVVCEIQMYQGGQWVTLKTWTANGNGVAAISETYYVEYGNDYRVYVTGYVYDDNGNLLESASGSDAKYCPWPLRSID